MFLLVHFYICPTFPTPPILFPCHIHMFSSFPSNSSYKLFPLFRVKLLEKLAYICVSTSLLSIHSSTYCSLTSPPWLEPPPNWFIQEPPPTHSTAEIVFILDNCDTAFLNFLPSQTIGDFCSLLHS